MEHIKDAIVNSRKFDEMGVRDGLLNLLRLTAPEQAVPVEDDKISLRFSDNSYVISIERERR